MAIDSNNIPLALTYDDVLLVPQRSDIQSRKQVDTTSQLTRNITLKVPIVSANMDTISSVPLAISMAKAGSCAILERSTTIEEMCNQIRAVKRHESLIISDPRTANPADSANEVIAQMVSEGISGMPVVKDGKLVGMITRRDLEAKSRDDHEVEELMTARSNLVVGSGKTTHIQALELMKQRRVEKLPLVNDKDELCGLITKKDIKNQSKYPLATKDKHGRLVVGAAVGVRGDYLERAKACEEAGADFLCLDIAHGHADHAIEAVINLKKVVSIDIIAGNVATAQACADLVEAGADAIKAGIGAGAVCSTRITAGVGMPMVTSLLECAAKCKELGVPLIADGGIRMAGDVAKAIACGASTVMIGRLLAGTIESPGEVIQRADGRLEKAYRGMASADVAKNLSKLEKPIVEKQMTFENEQEAFNQTTPEGVSAVVPFTNVSVKEVCYKLAGGLRSGMSYSNARTIAEYHEKAQFVRITSAGLIESHPHDVSF